MKPNLNKTALSVLLCLAAALPAHAIGRMADVTVVDRETGVTLPLYRHAGQYWVAGRPGARYAIAVTNQRGERVMAVISVDGINVVSGETAAWSQTGYVFSGFANYQISGWRKSDQEVAAFEFAASDDSYAGRTGRPGQVGVIGVALFREKLPEPAPHMPSIDGFGGARSNDSASPPASASAEQKSIGSSAGANRSRGDAQEVQSMAAPRTTPKLGTGHGQRETSTVARTSFERQHEHPDEIIRIRYDSLPNLIAAGVIRAPVVRQAPTPNPFPESERRSYVPDPPARRY